MYICKNPVKPFHEHATVYEGRVCWGLIKTGPAPDPITSKQLKFIVDLGGDEGFAKTLTKEKASQYIRELLAKPQLKKEEPVPTATTRPPQDKRLVMLASLMEPIRDGYYATQLEDGAKINFLRISRPKHRRSGKAHWAGSVKIQTQHGPRLENAAALWPEGRWWIGDNRVIEMLMLLVVDQSGCAMRYARELGRCCRCNAELTDERSRHYGIGPECEKQRPDIIARVDELHDGTPFEYLPR